MTKRVLGCAAFAAVATLIAAPAMAADLPVKAPVLKAPAEVVTGWLGHYVGVGIGGRFVDADWQTTCLAPAAGPPCPVSSGLNPAVDWAARLANANPSGFDSSSVRVSAYFGWNYWQWHSFVFGVEADVAWADNKSTRTGIPGTFLPGATTLDTATVKDGWEASIRTRTGYVVSPNMMVYYTSGLAFIRKEISVTCATAFAPTGGGWCATVPQTSSASSTRMGWTMGIGAEWKHGANWVIRGEYRYTDYRTETFRVLTTNAIDSLDVEIKQRTHTVYLGVSYFFAPTAVAARY